VHRELVLKRQTVQTKITYLVCASANVTEEMKEQSLWISSTELFSALPPQVRLAEARCHRVEMPVGRSVESRSGLFRHEIVFF